MNAPCFGCRKAEGIKFYKRMKLRATYCAREWLCKDCKQHLVAVGFTLIEVA